LLIPIDWYQKLVSVSSLLGAFTVCSIQLIFLYTKSSAVARVGPTGLVITDLEGHTRSMIFLCNLKGRMPLLIDDQ